MPKKKVAHSKPKRTEPTLEELAVNARVALGRLYGAVTQIEQMPLQAGVITDTFRAFRLSLLAVDMIAKENPDRVSAMADVLREIYDGLYGKSLVQGVRLVDVFVKDVRAAKTPEAARQAAFECLAHLRSIDLGFGNVQAITVDEALAVLSARRRGAAPGGRALLGRLLEPNDDAARKKIDRTIKKALERSDV